MTVRWLGATSLCVLLIGPACAADDEPSACSGERCPGACTELQTRCDVLEDRCREAILEVVACVRETPGTLPEVRILTTAQFEDEYGPMIEDAGADSGGAERAGAALPGDAGAHDASVASDAGSAPDSADGGAQDGGEVSRAGDPTLAWSTGLQLLGLLAPTTDAETASTESFLTFTAGLYSSVDQRITLIDRGTPLDTRSARALFAHELVHALQDQTFGLYEFSRSAGSTTDARLARGCLIEGDASLYEELADGAMQGVELSDGYWETRLSDDLKRVRRGVLLSDSPYASASRLRYPVGTRYLRDAYVAGGPDAVQAVFESPPIATVQWLVGYDASRSERLFQPLACNDAAVPEGYERFARDSLGALVFYAFLGRVTSLAGHPLESEGAWRDAAHWRQDSFAIFTGAKAAVAVSYRVRFSASDVAERVAAELTDSDVLVHRAGPEIEVLAATDPAALQGWSTDPGACPTR